MSGHVKNRCICRKVNCQYCHDTGEHHFIVGQHREECSKLPLPCPNECEASSVPRENMEAHRKECPLEMIQCDYYSVGCKRVKLTRKDLENHNRQNMEEHLTMTKNELINTKAQLQNTTAQLQNTTAQLDIAVNQITNLALLVNAHLTPSISDADLRSFQLVSMVTLFKSTCPVIIMMKGYKDKKDSTTEWFSDPFYTHSKGYKMCLCVDAGGDVNVKGTHLSVYLFLMKGPHDDELTWPLRGKFEIELLNQIRDSHHHSMTLDYGDDDENVPVDCSNRVIECEKAEGWGEPKFISNKNLHKITPTCQYLKADCLFFKVNFVA